MTKEQARLKHNAYMREYYRKKKAGKIGGKKKRQQIVEEFLNSLKKVLAVV